MSNQVRIKTQTMRLPLEGSLIAFISSLLTSKYIDMAVDLMVMPLSFSSSRVSVTRETPTFDADMKPAFKTSESVSVDFP